MDQNKVTPSVAQHGQTVHLAWQLECHLAQPLRVLGSLGSALIYLWAHQTGLPQGELQPPPSPAAPCSPWVILLTILPTSASLMCALDQDLPIPTLPYMGPLPCLTQCLQNRMMSPQAPLPITFRPHWPGPHSLGQ